MQDLPNLLRLISHGVYVIGVGDGERRNAFTAAWVMQASFAPPLLVLSVHPQHYSYRLLLAGRCCSVNVLGQGQLELARHFGQSAAQTDKMAGHPWRQARTGAPILETALAYFDCTLLECHPAGDHHLAVCEVVEAKRLNPGMPLAYNDTGTMDGADKLY